MWDLLILPKREREWKVTDAVMSIGEHIPAPFEYAFMKNLLKSAGKMVILSWAVLGQGGIGHVNEQTAEQIVQKMKAWGWAKDEILTMDLKTAAKVEYIKRNVQVFVYVM